MLCWLRNAGAVAGNCATCCKTRRAAALRRSDGRFGATAHSSLRCSIRQDPIAWFIPQSARNYYRGRSIIDDAFARTRAAAAAAAAAPRLFVCRAVMKLLRRDATASSNARPLFIFITSCSTPFVHLIVFLCTVALFMGPVVGDVQFMALGSLSM